ncbi:CotO family spore coat protein [Bacillus sp. CGMCC 1.16541]|uniref:CotO family spore coat protein n=1 Tax=Bacillus sp. CGMCC 1.16541 TaxID=2185143 RepID=UPI000D7369B6|nr:CotO family spore coat protein [Bacillus sp. CGMCC 1.16541]
MTNSKSRSEENEPLMYIVQPTIHQSKRSMQYYFHSQTDQPKQVVSAKSEKKKPIKKEEPSFSLIQTVDESVKKEEARKPNKMFQDMTIEEKAVFLAGFPKHMSQPICEVTTKVDKYVGTILEVKGDVIVFTAPPKKEELKIKLDNIRKISIIKI